MIAIKGLEFYKILFPFSLDSLSIDGNSDAKVRMRMIFTELRDFTTKFTFEMSYVVLAFIN